MKVIFDIETGEPIEIDDDTYARMQAWRTVIPERKNKDGKPIGTIQVIGTMSDDFDRDISKLWNDSPNYKLIK